jgi:hypothetical protein
MMIRARDLEHIEQLQARFPALKEYDIKESTRNDYRFRIIAPKAVWQEVMTALIEEQDYDNFKGAVDSAWGTTTPEQRRYHDLLMKVWSAAYGFQGDKYGPGIYSTSSTAEVPEDTSESPPLREEPGPSADVLVVLDQDNGNEVVVVWSPSCYAEPERAYADAIAAEVCDVVAHPEFRHMPWSEAKISGAPIFDAQEAMDG